MKVLNKLTVAGVHVWLDGENIRATALKGVMTGEILTLLRENKASLSILLQEMPRKASLGERSIHSVDRPVIKKWPGREDAPVSVTPFPLWPRIQNGHLSPVETNMIQCFTIGEDLDVAALKQALSWIEERHRILGGKIVDVGGEHFYRLDGEGLQIEYRDIDTESPDENSEYLGICQDFCWKAFDVSKSLARALILRLTENSYILCLVVHHLACDGASKPVILADLKRFYGLAKSGGSPNIDHANEINYLDYLNSLSEWLHNKEIERQTASLVHRLADFPDASLTPDIQAPTSNGQQITCSSLSESISGDFMYMLHEVCRRDSVTSFVVFLAAQSLAIMRDSGKRKFAFRVTTANRQVEGTSNLVGLLANHLIVPISAPEEATFLEFLREIRSAWIDALQFDNIPSDELARCYPNLSATVFNFVPMDEVKSNSTANRSSELAWKPLSVPYMPRMGDRKSVGQELSAHAVFMTETTNAFMIYVLYTSYYSEGKIRTFLKDVVGFVEDLYYFPDRKVAERK